jgi:hypothetical protein
MLATRGWRRAWPPFIANAAAHRLPSLPARLLPRPRLFPRPRTRLSLQWHLGDPQRQQARRRPTGHLARMPFPHHLLRPVAIFATPTNCWVLLLPTTGPASAVVPRGTTQPRRQLRLSRAPGSPVESIRPFCPSLPNELYTHGDLPALRSRSHASGASARWPQPPGWVFRFLAGALIANIRPHASRCRRSPACRPIELPQPNHSFAWSSRAVCLHYVRPFVPVERLRWVFRSWRDSIGAQGRPWWLCCSRCRLVRTGAQSHTACRSARDLTPACVRGRSHSQHQAFARLCPCRNGDRTRFGQRPRGSLHRLLRRVRRHGRLLRKHHTLAENVAEPTLPARRARARLRLSFIFSQPRRHTHALRCQQQ